MKKNGYIYKIEMMLQVKVKGYCSLRPAVCIMKAFDFEIDTPDEGGGKVEAVMSYLKFVTVRCKDGKRVWLDMNELSEGVLKDLCEKIGCLADGDGFGDYWYRGEFLRAFNPWWMVTREPNDVLDKILDESLESYQRSVFPDELLPELLAMQVNVDDFNKKAKEDNSLA